MTEDLSRSRRRSRPGLRRLGFLPTALLVLSGAAGVAHAARLTEVRVGEYDTFTRVVLQLDAAAGYRVEREVVDSGQRVLVTLAAASQTGGIETRSERLREIALEDVAGAYSRVRLELASAGLRIERMVLEDPPRLVLDVVDADDPSPARARAGTPPAWIESTAMAVPASPPVSLASTAPAGAPVVPASTRSLALQALATHPAVAAGPAAGEAVVRASAPRAPVSAVPAAMPEVPDASDEAAPAPPIQVADAGDAAAPLVLADVTGDEAGGTVRIESEAPAAGTSGGEPFYPVTHFDLRYAEPHPKLPSEQELGSIEVVLGQVADGYVAPRGGVPTVRIRLSDTFAPPNNRFYASAILAVNQAVVSALNGRGYVGVLAEPSDKDVAPRTGADLRPHGRSEMGIVVWVGRVKDIRTFASGSRVDPDRRLDNPVHHPIIERSPVQADGTHDLIRKDELDDYAARLNRHPGRRVDVLISPAREPGGAYLDYLISEWKPWWVYAGASNTGTDSTTKWRERFGFTHTQLTNHDDILAVDYVTGNFSEQLNAASILYDFPIWFARSSLAEERLRFRAFGNFLDYNASVFGFPGTPFQGTSVWGGGDLVGNVFQYKSFFVDLYGGLRYAHHRVKNKTVGTDAEDDFFMPRWGLKTQRLGDTNAFYMDLNFEANVANVSDTQLKNINDFGRFPVDRNWVVMRWDAAAWTYLEPLIFGDSWKDPSSPGTSTLAHELYAALRGQYSFDNKLIPQEMYVLGGLYTVRGYDEAAVSGDTAVVGNLEYRLHIPRLLPIEKQPRQLPYMGGFRFAPQSVYGSPDWDLIFRVFLDVGWTQRLTGFQFGYPEFLMGTGAGLELMLRRNFNVRVDYGWILNSLESRPGQQVGDGRVNFMARILY